MTSVLAVFYKLLYSFSSDLLPVLLLGRAPSPAQSAAGVAEVRVRNRGAVSVAAFAIALNPSQKGDEVSPFVAFFDTIVDRTEPLQQDEERTVPVLLRLRPGTRLEEVFELPIITAGILTDNTTTGDAVLRNSSRGPARNSAEMFGLDLDL